MHEASGQLALDGLEHSLYPDQTKELNRLVAEERRQFEHSRQQKFQMPLGETAVQSAAADEHRPSGENWTEQAA